MKGLVEFINEALINEGEKAFNFNNSDNVSVRDAIIANIPELIDYINTFKKPKMTKYSNGWVRLYKTKINDNYSLPSEYRDKVDSDDYYSFMSQFAPYFEEGADVDVKKLNDIWNKANNEFKTAVKDGIKRNIIGKDGGAEEPVNMNPSNKKELVKTLKRLIKERGKDADLNDINVSKVTDMSLLFSFETIDTHIGNINISKWDVSNCERMAWMFNGCDKFNCDLSKWDVSKCENMSGMFAKCHEFNCDLSKWDVSNCKDLSHMFSGCHEFNCDLSKWDVSNCERMAWMFNGCDKFNCDLSKWDVSKCKEAENIFKGCTHIVRNKSLMPKFSQNISIWR